MKLELRTALALKYNDFIGATFEELVLPEGMTEIPGSLCEDCRQLRKVVLPSTIKRIDVGAFNGCRKLEEINLPDGLEEIADNVFQGCHALRHIILPPGLKRLSPEIFDNSGLESIELPYGLESIGYWAFYGCNSLKSLEIPSSVRDIGFGIVSAHDDFSLVCHAEGFHVENDALYLKINPHCNPKVEEVLHLNDLIRLFANTETPLWGFASDESVATRMEVMYAYSPKLL